MDSLDLKGNEETPGVKLNSNTGTYEISGRSLPSDALAFYKPVLMWLSEYSQQPNPETVFLFKLEYMNTGSAKSVLDILALLTTIPGAKVHWYFQDEDEDMEEAGEEFAELVKVPFTLISY